MKIFKESVVGIYNSLMFSMVVFHIFKEVGEILIIAVEEKLADPFERGGAIIVEWHHREVSECVAYLFVRHPAFVLKTPYESRHCVEMRFRIRK